MLDCKMALEEISGNDLMIDVEETITGLQMAGLKLSVAVKGNTDGKDDGISSLNAIISAMAYISIMHGTVEAIRTGLQERKGGVSC